MRQRQFLNVVSDAEAHRILDDVFANLQAQSELVTLAEAHGRILFKELRSAVDVPGFDRSNMDGFAIRAADSYGADESQPQTLALAGESIAAGALGLPLDFELEAGQAVAIATGGLLPRGADAVLMVEDSNLLSADTIEITRALAPGANLSGAGSDIGRGEIVLHAKSSLGSRETVLAAAVGAAELEVFRRPRAAVLSTGDEVKEPGSALALGEIL